ncbi:hypothetical protein [Companilactobacillus hulinensis]|uniref:hypothetical protein n=1 Tax=Companilactobacillus hulinensis TaxID=2486007 RepID=UPI000F7B440B|nr:hypothetical protein [Companilactobacillus hulinensis]
MNAAQKKAMVYGNLINGTVQSIQDEQDKLNPEFETLRKALDRDQVEKIDAVEYTKIMHDFKSGTENYQSLLAKLQKAKAPARYMGTHMSLVSAFKKYVEGCADMTDSINEDQTIDREKFNTAEKVQDENMDKFSKYMQKMTEI